MLQINAEIYFKSVNEKHAFTFLISTVWRKRINAYILFIFSLFTICPIFTLVFFIMNKKEHLRRYCISRMSDAMCDAIFFSPSLELFSFINKSLT